MSMCFCSLTPPLSYIIPFLLECGTVSVSGRLFLYLESNVLTEWQLVWHVVCYLSCPALCNLILGGSKFRLQKNISAIFPPIPIC